MTSETRCQNTPFHRPSLSENLAFLIQGAIMSVPMSVFFESFFTQRILSLDPYISDMILTSVIMAPIIEEFAKIFPLFNRHGESETNLLQLGFLTGLGFGLAEYFIYVTQYNAPFMSRIPQVFFHASLSTISAYGVAKSRFLPFFLLAVVFHAIFNLVAGDGVLILVALLMMGLSILLAWDLHLSVEARVDKKSQEDAISGPSSQI